MKKGIRKSILLPGAIFLLLIMGSKTAAAGIAEGINQCIQVIIPSLFPFFFVSCWFNGKLHGVSLPLLRPVGRLLSLPNGAESILLIGLLGGYPVGAKAVKDAYDSSAISKKTADILLGYCNNAGPAFIFGICHILFSSVWIPWIVWSLQIASAIITGILLPKPTEMKSFHHHSSDDTLTSVLQKSISITAMVCGWIVLFRALLYAIDHVEYIRIYIPILAGLLELSNGAIMLKNIVSPALRFILLSVFLCAGGLCVFLQTHSTVSSIGTGLYLPGKCIQTAISILISIPIACLSFHEFPFSIPILVTLICVCIWLIHRMRVKCRKTYGNYEYDRV